MDWTAILEEFCVKIRVTPTFTKFNTAGKKKRPLCTNHLWQKSPGFQKKVTIARVNIVPAFKRQHKIAPAKGENEAANQVILLWLEFRC